MPVGTDFADVLAVAPPRAPDAATRINAPDDGPSFEEHLSAEAHEETAPPREHIAAHDEQIEEEPIVAADPSEAPSAPVNAAPQAPQQPQQPQQQRPASPPALIQIMASLNAAAEQITDATAMTEQATTPPPSAPPPIAPQVQTAAPQTPQHVKTQSRGKAAPSTKAPSVTDSSVTAAPQANSKQAPQQNASDGAIAPATTEIAAATDQPQQQSQQPQHNAETPCAPAPVQAQVQPATLTPTLTPQIQTNDAASTAAPTTAPPTTPIDAAAPAPPPAPASNVAPITPQPESAPKTAPEIKADANQAPQQADAPTRAPKRTAADKSAPAQAQAKDAFSALLAQTTETQTPRAAAAPLTASTTHASAAAGATTSLHAGAHPPASTQVAREIIRRSNGENTRFELRLDPPELGRVEIKLEMTRDQKVTAIVSADNPQALADLTRHARDLEQSLQSAGLELSDSGLSFDLSQSRQGQQNENESAGTARNSANTAASETETPNIVRASPLGLERWAGHRIDLVA